MSNNDFLFDLIHSLDEAEIRFIRKFETSKRKRPEILLDLLDDIRNGKDRSPEFFKQKYRNFGVARYKLKQLILRSLRLLNTSEDAERHIRDHLDNELILYRKGLFDEAGKQLKAARKIAGDHQKLYRLLEILQRQQSRLIEYGDKKLKESVVENAAEMARVLAQLNQQLAALCNYQQLFAAFRTEDVAGMTGQQRVSFPDDLPENVPLSFEAQVYHLQTRSLLARSQRDWKAAGEAIAETIALYQNPSHKAIREDQQDRYKILLANYATYLVPVGKFHELADIVLEFRQMNDSDFNGKAETFQNRVQLELLWMVNTFDFSRLPELIEEIKAGFGEFGSKINAARQLSIRYNIVEAWVIQENFREARAWIDEILDQKKNKVRQEIQYVTRLMELLIYIELELYDPLDARITAVERFLQRKDQMTPFKSGVVKVLRKLTGTPLNERKELFQDLHQTLQSLRDEMSVGDQLGLKIVSAWAEAKVRGCSIVECLS